MTLKEIRENKESILAKPAIRCPDCNSLQESPVDKLYIEFIGTCFSCDDMHTRIRTVELIKGILTGTNPESFRKRFSSWVVNELKGDRQCR